MKKLVFILVLSVAALVAILSLYADKKKEHLANATILLQNEGITVTSLKINSYLPDDIYTATYNGNCRIVVKRGKPTSTLLDDTCGE